MADRHPWLTDGIVMLRPCARSDIPRLVAGRDAEAERWLGAGDPEPAPLFCIEVAGDVVGWIDHDEERTWLQPGEVNVGYALFEEHRGCGYVTRALQLLMHHLAIEGRHRTATLLIDALNVRSQAVAARTRFERQADLDGHPYFTRPVPPIEYTDGVVRIRPRSVDDLDADLEALDAHHQRWLWTPRQRRAWCDMAPDERREQARRVLTADAQSFATGPRWAFSVDRCGGPRAVAVVDANLASEHAPHGTANIAYSAHPEHRRRGYVTRAVALLGRFLAEHTATPGAAIVIDEANHPSHRVARALGAELLERTVIDGRPMTRYRLSV